MSERLLVPGRLDVVVLDGGGAWIERGPLADIPPAVPAQEDLGPVSLVPLAFGEEGGPSLDQHPFVRAQRARLRWRLVSRTEGDRAYEAGHPVLDIDGGRPGAAWRQPGEPERSFEAADPVLWELLLGEDPDPDTVHRWAETGALQDRLVTTLSGGQVTLRDVELARWAAGLRTATLDHEEAILAEIAERAVAQQERAVAVLQGLDDAGDADTIELSGLGVATRVVDPGFTLEDGGSVRVRGAALQVPEQVLYRVERVDSWEPSAAGARREASFADWHARIQETRRKGKRRELLVWGAVGGLLMLLVSLALLGPLLATRLSGAAASTDTDAAVEATDRAPEPSR